MRHFIAGLTLGAVLSACGSNSPAAPLPGVASPLNASSDTQEKAATCRSDGLGDPSAVADLDGNGTKDALVLLKEEPGNSSDPYEAKRPLAIALRDDSGCLRVAKKNDRMVPCERCGGVSGDPFAGVTTEGPGSFLVAIEGGSRERWYSWYTFAWSPDHKDWTLIRVQRGVSDTSDGKERSIDLSASDFGLVRFAEFDPAIIPEVSLP